MSAPPAGISIREFAKRDGCNDKLVRRAIEKGKIKPFLDGSLDPALVGTSWRQGNRRSADTPADTFQEDPPRESAPKAVYDPAPFAIPPVRVIPDRDLTAFIDLLLGGNYHAEADAIAVKENGLALKHMLEARKRAGELIEIEQARTILFEVFRGARDAWINFPSKIGPHLAADLGIDAGRVTEALTGYVHQQLLELGEQPEADFAAGETN